MTPGSRVRGGKSTAHPPRHVWRRPPRRGLSNPQSYRPACSLYKLYSDITKLFSISNQSLPRQTAMPGRKASSTYRVSRQSLLGKLFWKASGGCSSARGKAQLETDEKIARAVPSGTPSQQSHRNRSDLEHSSRRNILIHALIILNHTGTAAISNRAQGGTS